MDPQPPAGNYADFNPYSTIQARGLVALAAVMMFLATAALVARFACRKMKGIKINIDEWLLVIALIILDVKLGGTGHHFGDVPPSYLLTNAKLAFSAQLFYPLTMAPVRWSLLSLFIRIFIYPTFRRIAYAIAALNGAWFVFNILGVTLRCHPIDLNWDMSLDGHCANLITIALIAAIWSLILSAMVWILPIPVVWHLQTSLKNKLGFTFLFGLGIFDIIVGIVRVVTTVRVDVTDITWTTVPSLSWILVEPAVAIIVACLPVCRPLFDKILPDAMFQRLSSVLTSRFHLLRSSRRDRRSPIEQGSSKKYVELGKIEAVGRKGVSETTIEASHKKKTRSDDSFDRQVDLEDGIHVRRDIYVGRSDGQ